MRGDWETPRTSLDVKNHLHRLLVERDERTEARQVEVVLDKVLCRRCSAQRSAAARAGQRAPGGGRGRGRTSATSQKYSWPGRAQNQLIQVRVEVVVLADELLSAG